MHKDEMDHIVGVSITFFQFEIISNPLWLTWIKVDFMLFGEHFTVKTFQASEECRFDTKWVWVKYHFNLLIDSPYLVKFSSPCFPCCDCSLSPQIGSHCYCKDDWHILSQWHSLRMEVNAKDMTSEPRRWRRTSRTEAGFHFRGHLLQGI